MPKARIETEFTGNDASFMAAAQRVEKRGQSLSQRLTGLFRRSPERKAEQALGIFTSSLASGDISGAITGISHRLSGIGLAAGIGVGAAALVFEKAKHQIDEVDKSVITLNKDLARPSGLQSALGPEGISKEIETTQKHLEDLVEKRGGFFQKLREAAIRGQPDIFNIITLQVETPDRVPQAAKAQEAAQKRLRELSRARADSELDIVEAQRISLTQSEREGTLFKLRLDTKKKLAELGLDEGLNKPGRDQGVFFRRAAAISQSEKLSTDEVNRRADLKENEAALEERILKLQTSSLSTSQQELSALRERINLLKSQLSLQLPEEKRRDIGTEIQRLQNQETQAAFGESQKSGSQKLGEFLKQSKFAAYAKFHSGVATSPNAYIHHPDAYTQSPGAYDQTGPQNTENDDTPITRNEMDELLNTYIGK